jgi:hypothetical protein
MTTFLHVVLIAAVVFGLRWLFQGRASARRARMNSLAAQLGLRKHAFDALGSPLTGDAASVGSPTGPLAPVLTAAWGERAEFHGTWQGRAVSLNALPCPRYRIAVAARCSLPVDAHLFATSPSGVPGGPPKPLPVAASGDADFDRAVRVYARDVPAARALLARDAVRGALREITTGPHSPRVYDNWVYAVPYDHELFEADAARRLLDEVVRLAGILDRAL